MTDPDGPPRAALIAALVVAVAAVGAVLAIAATRRVPQHVAIVVVPAPHATDPSCAALLAALPRQLGGGRRAVVAQPAPAGVAAWQADDGEAVVVLRCGLDRPAEFVVGSAIQVVDAVQWFRAGTGERPTWYTVDRPVYVALTLAPGSGPAAIQQISELIEDTVAAVPINPAPVS